MGRWFKQEQKALWTDHPRGTLLLSRQPKVDSHADIVAISPQREYSVDGSVSVANEWETEGAIKPNKEVG